MLPNRSNECNRRNTREWFQLESKGSEHECRALLTLRSQVENLVDDVDFEENPAKIEAAAAKCAAFRVLSACILGRK